MGFGVNGSNLARILKESGIPYIVLEMNANTVKKMKKMGEPIYYGDGTSPEILHKMGIHKANVLVVAISDPAATRRIVQIARHENPDMHIIVRTRYVAEVDDLLKLGADDVIPEEFETSVEIFSRVLAQYQVPKNEIYNLVDMVREDGYKALRQTGTTVRKPLFDQCTVLSNVNVEVFTINADSPVRGKSIKDIGFRTKTGATIIAVERDGHMHISPDPAFSFDTGDVVFITGKKENINKAIVYLFAKQSVPTDDKIDE